MANILIVDDDLGFIEAVQEIFHILGQTASVATSVSEAKAKLDVSQFDMLILDIMLPDGSGFEIMEDIKATDYPTHVAFVSGHSVVKNIAHAVNGENVSFLIKPVTLDKLKKLLFNIGALSGRDSDPDKHFGYLVGESVPMKALYQKIDRVATTSANVMIQGESGTGKELVASAIHRLSGCRGDFVATNCGAISPELIGSELFGHEKGAFTGAVNRKIGLFERANGGVLFLDEITEMPIDLQPHLLRALETKRITRLGGSKEIDIDCRVVSATNRKLSQLAEDNCLREDLYYRLAVFPIEVPALRDRMEDIVLLSKQFLKELNQDYGTDYKLDDLLIDKLRAYDWPGNVRELRHSIHRAFILTDSKSSLLQLPDQLNSPFSKSKQPNPSLMPGRTIQDVERELIAVTLKRVDNNKPKAAEMLGISLKTLYNRLNEYSKDAEAIEPNGRAEI